MYFTKDEVIVKIIEHLDRLGVTGVKPAWFRAYRSHYLFGWLQGLRESRIPRHLVDLLGEHGVSVTRKRLAS